MKDKVKLYFDVASKSDPVITEDDIMRQLNQRRSFSKSRIRVYTMVASMVIITTIGLVYYLNENTTQPILTQVETNNENNIGSGADSQHMPKQNTLETVEAHSNQMDAKVNTHLIDKSVNMEQSFLLNIPTQDTSIALLPTNDNNRQDIHQKEGITEEGILMLTQNEMKNLGIFTNGKNLGFACRRHELDDSMYFLVDCEFGGINSFDGAEAKHVKNRTIADLIPVAIAEGNATDFIYMNPEVPYNRRDQFIHESRKMLVQIPVTLNAGAKKERRLFFWYKPDISLIDLIPEVAKNSILPSIQQFDDLNYAAILKKYRQIPIIPVYVSLVKPEHVKQAAENTFELNDEELAKLHIKSTYNGFTFKNKFMYRGKSCKLEIRYDSLINYYAVNVQNNKSIFAEPEITAIRPIATTDSTLKEIQLYPIISSKAESGSNHLDAEIKNNLHFLDAIPDLIAVKLVTRYNGGRRVRLIWFADSIATVRDVIKDHMAYLQPQHAVDLSKVKLIEPDEETRNKLHILIEDGSIGVPMMWGTKSSIIQRYSAKGSEFMIPSISQSEYQLLPEHEKGDSIKLFLDDGQMTELTQYFKKTEMNMITPVMATDEQGKHFYFHTADDVGEVLTKEDYHYMREHHLRLSTYPKAIRIAEKQRAQASDKAMHLIGMRVTSSPFPTAKGFFSMILWYEPTPEFLAVLPKNIGTTIQSEYEALLHDAPAPSCNYFEACKNIKGEICQLTAFPNPFVDELDLELELGNDRVINIALTDLNGKLVKQAEQNKTQLKGKSNYQIRTENLSEGIYLVVITTDKGERMVKRVIKK